MWIDHIEHHRAGKIRILGVTGAKRYALCDQEIEMGLRSIAVPILSRDGKIIAAMSLSVEINRMDVNKMLEKLLPELERAKQKFPALL